MTNKASITDQWVNPILAIHEGRIHTVVGLDIGRRPHKFSWAGLSNKSATLQLCIDDKCLIVQLFYIDYVFQSLKEFLRNPNFTFVRLDVGDDHKDMLKNEYGLSCRRITDICNLVERGWPGRFGTRSAGLKEDALEIGLNMKKPRHVTNSN